MKIFNIYILILFFPFLLSAQQDSSYLKAKKFVDDYYKNNCNILNRDYFYKQDSLFYENVIDYLSNTIKRDSNYWKTNKSVNLLVKYCRIRYTGISQKATKYITDVLNYPEIRCKNEDLSENDIYDFSKEDFNKKTKEKILFLISGKYTQDDFRRHKTKYKTELLKGYDTDIKYSWFWIKYIEKQAKKTGKSKQQIKDSIYSVWLKRDLPQFKMNRCYHKNLIYAIGKNYMREFIPHLKNLIDTAEGFPVYFSKLVLARMGEEPYLTEILDALAKFEFVPDEEIYRTLTSQVMFVANNPRSINILKKWMDAKYLMKHHGWRKGIKSGFFATWCLDNFLIEFPKKYQDNCYPDPWNNCPDAIGYTKQWLGEKKDIIHIDNMIYLELNGGLGLTTNINKNKYFREKYLKSLESAKKELELKRKEY